MDNKTICALSSPVGTGALHIIRVSGPEALSIVSTLFCPAGKRNSAKNTLLLTPGGRFRYGLLRDPKTGEILDEVVLSVFRAPKSFTGEDTVEISCHGGMYIVKRILEELIKAGCRMAERGEFSKRAFLNGKMDLNEAEAVMDMIAAKTKFSLKAASQQLEGVLSREVEEIRTDLIRVLSDIDVNIDYPEYEDVPEISEEAIFLRTENALKKIEKLLSTSGAGKLMKNGIKTCLLGSPNVGKSSLLNYFLKEERAIVTEIPGTTRDVIEGSVDLDGIELILMDTAGVRKTENPVEKIGVEKSLKMVEQADLVLYLLDAQKEVTDEDRELYASIKDKAHLVLVNKEDLLLAGPAALEKDAFLRGIRQGLGMEEASLPILISVKTGSGMEEVFAAIKEKFFQGGILEEDGPLVTNLRQEEALYSAKGALERVLEAKGMPEDLLTIDLEEACDALSKVLGKSTSEDVISDIFSRFCLGK